MILVILICGVILLSIIWWYIKYYYHFNNMLDIPTTKFVIPIIGVFVYFNNPIEASLDLYRLLKTRGNYKTIRTAVGFHFGLVSADPALMEHILTHPRAIEKSWNYKFLHPWLGKGLLTNGGPNWRTHRKFITSAYHFKILEQFIDVFEKNGNILIQRLRREIGKNETDIFPYMSLYALDTICETAMGTPIHAQENSHSEYVHAVQEFARLLIKRIMNIAKHSDFLFSFTKDYQLQQKALKILHNQTISVINKRKEELLKIENNKTLNYCDDNDIGYKKKVPFLDLLLQTNLNNEVLSDEEIKDEVDTFMLAGHDTASSAISFCIYCLSINPEIQNKVITEQRIIYQDNPHRETTLSDVNQMKYLEMVIKESLRLYPSAPIIGRTISEDIQYESYTFKKGFDIGFSIYTLHRNPEIYPNPECFDPMRFTPEMQANRHPFAYLPFSAGYRNCVGQKFAMLEMKVTLSKLTRSYIFSAVENYQPQLTSSIVLTSTNGIIVGIKERQW